MKQMERKIHSQCKVESDYTGDSIFTSYAPEETRIIQRDLINVQLWFKVVFRAI